MYPSECRVPEKSKGRKEKLPKWSILRIGFRKSVIPRNHSESMNQIQAQTLAILPLVTRTRIMYCTFPIIRHPPFFWRDGWDMMIFSFYLVCFTFSISYSMLPLHLVYVFQFLHLFFIFFGVLSQALIKHSRKPFVYIYIFTTPWTAAYQAPPFMGFSRQEYWSGLPFPSPGELLDPGIKPRSPTLQADALTSAPPGKPSIICTIHIF